MNKIIMTVVFTIGLVAVGWVGWGFVGTSALALTMTLAIAAVYLLGAYELLRFRRATASLSVALADDQQPLADLGAWLGRLPPSLQSPVRLRIEGQRVALPGPALTPYLVGLLVMLGMLGTFLGMVLTFQGAVFALEGSSNLEAIRSALAAPIKGLGLAFGTSVAGVAASAMLGLLSALCRRERVAVVRQLDARIATVWRPLSASHQRQAAFEALQAQAQAMPLIVDRLQTLVDSVERRQEQLGLQLQAQQDQFHQGASAAYAELARNVGASLQDSLSASARLAGDSIKPVVENAMAALAQEARLKHQGLLETTQAQLEGQAAQWQATAREVASHWTQAVQTQSQSSEALLIALDRSLQGFASQFEARAGHMLESLQSGATQAQAEQLAAEQQRLESWRLALQGLGADLAREWQQVGAQTLAQQQAVCHQLETAAGQITTHATEHVEQTLGGVTQLLNQSEALVRSRTEAEGQWLQAQGERMDQLAGVWRQELAALRDEEAGRAEAAVQRLEALQGTVAEHLATLGAALEAPLNRLLNTASEVPQAAAQVIAQLRQEMTQLSERDNLALAERSAMTEQLGALLRTVSEAGLQQRAAIDSLVASAATVLEKAGGEFSQALSAQAGQVDEVAARVAASAIELSSLGETFSHGVSLFHSSSEKLVGSLQSIEGAISQSLTRSDEQLAYYVAQAREVIDLSISSQQGIVEDLRRLHGQAQGQAERAVS